MHLSNNFTLEELTVSQVAARNSLNNTPTGNILSNLVYTAQQLESVRTILGNPIIVSSGYRSAAVNKAVGGVPSSQHTKGQAVDFICPNFGSPKQIVEKLICSDINFDQLIIEFDRWVHISFTQEANRKQVLVIDQSGTKVFS